MRSMKWNVKCEVRVKIANIWVSSLTVFVEVLRALAVRQEKIDSSPLPSQLTGRHCLFITASAFFSFFFSPLPLVAALWTDGATFELSTAVKKMNVTFPLTCIRPKLNFYLWSCLNRTPKASFRPFSRGSAVGRWSVWLAVRAERWRSIVTVIFHRWRGGCHSLNINGQISWHSQMQWG